MRETKGERGRILEREIDLNSLKSRLGLTISAPVIKECTQKKNIKKEKLFF